MRHAIAAGREAIATTGARKLDPSIRGRGRSAFAPTAANGIRWAAIGLVALGCAAEVEDDPEPMGPTGSCVFDESYGPESPLADDPRLGVEGWLCPLEDEDWYTLEVPPSDQILRVELEMLGSRSPVDPVYAVYERRSAEAGEVVATADAQSGRPRRDTHCVRAGSYFLAVRDRGSNAQDRRNPYRLFVDSEPEPDANEPNDDTASAVALRSGEPVSGYVACRGDEDHFRIHADVGQILVVRLAMPETHLVPALRVFGPDGARVVEGTNPGAARGATSIVLSRVVANAGEHRIVVMEDTHASGDPDVAYELVASVLEDFDGNEPNDHPTEATPLAASPVACGDAWSVTLSATGTIGSAGDHDWFVLPTSGCAGGIVEAEVSFAASGGVDDQWALQTNVQASVNLVRSHPGSPCDRDEACVSLNAPCTDEWGCEGYFNACLRDGVCAGATVCMPNGQCGANQVQRHYQTAVPPGMPTEPPPPNRAHLVAPIFDDGPLFLRVTDFQSNGGDPEALYTLTVRIRRETDPADAAPPGNNLYTPTPLSSIPVRRSMSRAVEIPVQDCTAGRCCDSSTWVRGAIGYQHDQDFFAFPHPCPGEDCMIRIHYQVDEGPVRHAFWIYESGGGGFISRALPSGGSGVFGGLGAEADACTYAYHRHGGTYYVMLRDREDDGADADPEQQYRFCVEKIAAGCQAPCMDFGPDGGGCNVPR